MPAPIERTFSNIKDARRVATRTDKQDASFLSFVELVSIRYRVGSVNDTWKQ